MDSRFLIGIGVVVLIVGAIVVLGLNFGPQSIIIISNIVIQGQGEFIQANLAVNQTDSLWLIPAANVKQASDLQNSPPPNGYSEVLKDVKVSFSRDDILCTVPLRQERVYTNFGTTPVPFWEANGNYRRSVVSTVRVERANFASGVYDQTVGEHTFNACVSQALGPGQSCSAGAPVQSVVEFDTSDLGNVRIEDLGNLDNGGGCPDAGNFVVIQTSSGLKIVDRTHWLIVSGQTSFANCTSNVLSCVDSALNLLAQGGFLFPAGHYECPPFTSCAEQFILPLNTSQITYRIPKGSATPFVTVRMNKEFVGAVIFSPSEPLPAIVSAELVPSTLQSGQQGTLTVQVKNNGDSGDVRVAVNSQNGRAGIAPPSITKNISNGSTVSFSFTVAASSNVGSDNLQILAEGVGSANTDTRTVGFSVTNPSSQVCGDGVCSGTENAISCPVDCAQPEGHTECSAQQACVLVSGPGPNSCNVNADCQNVGPLVCAPWEVKIFQSQQAYLIDFGPIKFLPLGDPVTVPKCSLNFNLIFIIILAVLTAAAAYVVVTRK